MLEVTQLIDKIATALGHDALPVFQRMKLESLVDEFMVGHGLKLGDSKYSCKECARLQADVDNLNDLLVMVQDALSDMRSEFTRAYDACRTMEDELADVKDAIENVISTVDDTAKEIK